jgi:hypothetical protein
MTKENFEKAKELSREIEKIELFFSNLRDHDLVRVRRNDPHTNGTGMTNLDKEFNFNKSTHNALIKCLKDHLQVLKNEFELL